MQLRESPSRREEQNKLIAYLDQFGRQISSRKGHHGLEEQLSSLSRAYNQAQEKLLETERALMHESIMLEKQRSVIEIYKHILSQEMEDDGIIGFIQNMEADEDKRDIFGELEEIKALLGRKKRKGSRKTFGGDKAIKQLKQEVSRLEDEKYCIADQSQLMNSENEELKSRLETFGMELDQYQSEVEVLKKENYHLSASLQALKLSLEKEREEKRRVEREVMEMREQEREFAHLKKQHERYQEILSSKLKFSSEKENVRENRLNDMKKSVIVDELEGKLAQLLKYKFQYKKIKESHKDNDFLKQEVLVLKLFLSEEALKLIREFQEEKLECIETELRNLSVLEKNRLLKLEQCERDVWKYKLQAMREDEAQSLLSTHRIPMTHSLRSQPLSARLSAPLAESVPSLCEKGYQQAEMEVGEQC